MSPGVVQVRADICHDCPTPCAWRDCAEAHATACLACPVGRWGTWGACADGAPAPVQTGPRGLGDVVAVVAGPVGQVLGLDPSKCGCNRRQQALNEAVPLRGDDGPGVVV